jgi:hypothetical protein
MVITANNRLTLFISNKDILMHSSTYATSVVNKSLALSNKPSTPSANTAKIGRGII